MNELSLATVPARAAGAAEAITEKLRGAIVGGIYAHGQRLPAERELAEHFGAARGTVREALRRLEEERLLVRRVGSGTFVNFPQAEEPGEIADKTSPLELIEVRLALEPAICRLAAVNATRRDLEKLEEIFDRLESAGDLESFADADEAFHLQVANCTHNPLMIWLYQLTNEVRAHDQWAFMKQKILSKENIDAYNRQHREIFEAMRSRDVETVVTAIRAHLEKARQDLLGVRHL